MHINWHHMNNTRSETDLQDSGKRVVALQRSNGGTFTSQDSF
jgi:hypothetical protein